MKITGYLGSGRTLRDWEFGAINGKEFQTLKPNADWRDVLPTGERQNRGFETMSCVSHSMLNTLEIIDKINNIDTDWSDRALACASGTTSNGNTFYRVWETANKLGLCAENIWGYGGSDWLSYYLPLPQDVRDAMLDFTKLNKIGIAWIDKTKIKEALKKMPVWAANSGHAFVIVGEKDSSTWYVYDSYPTSDGDFIGEMPKSVIEASAFVWKELKQPTMYSPIANDSLVFETGQGRFGLKVGDKMYVDETDKIIAQWIMRTPDFKQKVTISGDHFNSFAHYNLKNEKLN